jgi:hypothetical protein
MPERDPRDEVLLDLLRVYLTYRGSRRPVLINLWFTDGTSQAVTVPLGLYDSPDQPKEKP